jgi:hypothetical protein
MLSDEDLGLLALFFVCGLLPGVVDALHGRAFGTAATLGLLLAIFAGWQAIDRLHTHLRARAIRRRLLNS